ncbi:MAG TPA: hypothetical protein VFD60_07190, partial [Nitrososphaeraceae archaeon]|nr:hypothetical protein [Nitrososphaeraceae archaeon]
DSNIMLINSPTASPARHPATAGDDQASISRRGVKSLFSKYERVSNPLVSQFISSIPDNFSGAVDRILHICAKSPPAAAPLPINDFILNNRVKLQKFIKKFHSEAGTMTADVSNSITLLNDPSTKLFVSIHQPNLFAYGGIFKKIVLLQTLKNEVEKKEEANKQQEELQGRQKGREDHSSKKIVNLFLIVDHDFMDGWVRLAQLPSVKHSLGRLELRLPVSTSNKWQMASNMPIPGQTVLNYWRKQITSWIRKNSASSIVSSAYNKSNMRDNFEQFWQNVELSYSKAKSYSDFNSFLMSEIVNTIWGYDTLFVRLTDISSVFEDGFRYLISNFDKYSDALRKAENMFLRHGIDTGVSASTYLNAPVWLHCECGSKASVKIYEKEILLPLRQEQQRQQRGQERRGETGEVQEERRERQQQKPKQKEELQKQIILKGTCISCKRDLQVNLGNKHTLELLKQEQILHQLSPRAIPILLLLSKELGVTCYVSGTGGSMDYTLVGGIAFKELSINMPSLTLIWPSRDIYYGIGQLEALELVQLTKQYDVIPYLESLKQKNADYEGKIKPLIEERNRKVKAGESIQTLLLDLFNLKEEQRKIRRLIKITYKVKNAVEMSPCFVDYAVNFGMANTETQWREHLLNNNNSLATPIPMTASATSPSTPTAITKR